MNPGNDALMKVLAEQPLRVTRAEAADFLNVSIRTLEEWQKKGLPPKAVKHGQRGVRYLHTDLIALRIQWAGSSN